MTTLESSGIEKQVTYREAFSGTRLRMRITGLAILTALVSGCSQNPASFASPRINANSERAIPLRGTMDLGVLLRGESIKLRFWIRNQSKETIQLTEAKSSCECLRVSLSNIPIPPEKSTLVSLDFNPAVDPDFVGSLQIELELMDRNGRKVGQIDVPVEILERL